MNRLALAMAASAALFCVSSFFLVQDALPRLRAVETAHKTFMGDSDESALTVYLRCGLRGNCSNPYRAANIGQAFPVPLLVTCLVSLTSTLALSIVWYRAPTKFYDASLAVREDIEELRTRDWLTNKNAGNSFIVGWHLNVPERGRARKAVLRGHRTRGTDPQLLMLPPGYGGRNELPHVAVFGTTRSGKTMHLIAQALRWTGSFIALDIKGEIYDLTSGVTSRRADQGQVYVLSPEGVGHQFNPLAELMSTEDGIKTAANIIAAPHLETGNGRFFAEKAAQGLEAAFYAARFLERSPFDLFHELILAGGMGSFVERLMAIDDPDVRFQLNAFLDAHGGSDFNLERALSHGALISSWSTMTKSLSPFLGPKVRWLLRQSDFRADSLLKKKTYVYLQFPDTTLSATKKVYDLIISGLTSGMYTYVDKTLKKQEPANRVLMLMDELYSAPVSNLPALYSTAASRHLTLSLYCHTPEMLNAIYGPDGREALLACCGLQLFYKSETPKMARYISEISGKTSLTEQRTSRRRQFWGGEAPTISEGNQSREVLTPDEVDMVGGKKREVILAKISGQPLAAVRRIDTRPHTPIGRRIKQYKPPEIPIPKSLSPPQNKARRVPELEVVSKHETQTRGRVMDDTRPGVQGRSGAVQAFLENEQRGRGGTDAVDNVSRPVLESTTLNDFGSSPPQATSSPERGAKRKNEQEPSVSQSTCVPGGQLKQVIAKAKGRRDNL